MSGPERTLLLVEDDGIIALDERRVLEKNGYHVVHAPSGERAVAVVRDNPMIALVLMDIDLGAGMDGTEAAQQILALRELLIVFLTSYSEREWVSKVKRITRYGYVLKNSGNHVLLESIGMAFELFDAHQRLVQENEERKAAERELRKAYTTLEAAEETALVGSWSMEMSSGVFRLSRNCCNLLGIEPEEFDGSWESAFSFVHPEDREYTENIARAVMEDNRTRRFRLRVVSADGTERQLFATTGMSYDDEGNPAALIGAVQDVSDSTTQ